MLRGNRQRKVVMMLATALLALTMSTSGVIAAGSKEGPSTRVIDGELYVKASLVPDVIKKVSPSVVAIIGKPADEKNASRFALSHGTGVFVKRDGWIVTNAHVVQDMERIVVVTSDGKEYTGTRKQIDPASDLALVKINAKGFKPAKLAAAPLKVEVGETVIAIGTPVSFSLRNTATVGVISGMNRSVSSDYNLLQTDAAINPGNSGGPLVNLKGEVVGINSMKFVDVDIDSMGFAIPADTVRYVLDHFDKYGKVKRASLGLELEESWSAVVGLPTEEPMTVLEAASPNARKVGISAGDQLYSVNGKQVSTNVELNELLKAFLPGQTVNVTLLSDGDLVTRKLVLSEYSGH